MPYVFPLVAIFSRYEVEDGGIRLFFVLPAPGPSMPTDADVLVTDAELAGVSTAVQLRDNLVLPKLRRKLHAENIATKLDPFVGQPVTVT